MFVHSEVGRRRHFSSERERLAVALHFFFPFFFFVFLGVPAVAAVERSARATVKGSAKSGKKGAKVS